MIDYDISSLSPENTLSARVLQLRARISIGQAEEVLADVEVEDQQPELAAVKALAHYTIGDLDEAIQEVEELVSSSSENAIVQVLGGTVLQAAGKTESALGLLMKHQGNLEAYVQFLPLVSEVSPLT